MRQKAKRSKAVESYGEANQYWLCIGTSRFERDAASLAVFYIASASKAGDSHEERKPSDIHAVSMHTRIDSSTSFWLFWLAAQEGCSEMGGNVTESDRWMRKGMEDPNRVMRLERKLAYAGAGDWCLCWVRCPEWYNPFNH